MPNNKVKTKKGLQGKGVGGGEKKTLHERSRRARQVNRVQLRDEKLSSAKKERRELVNVHRDQLLWFAKELDASVACLSGVPELHEMIQKYLDRHDAALEQEKAARRPGRPKSKLQERLEQAQETEASMYASSGIVVPDLTHEKAVVHTRHWLEDLHGDMAFKPRLRLVRMFRGSDNMVVEQQGAQDDETTSAPSGSEQQGGPSAESQGMQVEDA